MYREGSEVIGGATLILAIFFVVYGIGFTMGEQFTQKETINFCVEKPAECKTKYDYFKLLENQK